MDTILLKSENNKTSEPHRLLLTLAGKTNLKRRDKFINLFNLSMYYTWKHIKNVIQQQQISSISSNKEQKS